MTIKGSSWRATARPSHEGTKEVEGYCNHYFPWDCFVILPHNDEPVFSLILFINKQQKK